MVYIVEIDFAGQWWPLNVYPSRGSAEWSVGMWRQIHGSNGLDTGFRVRELFPEEKKVKNESVN